MVSGGYDNTLNVWAPDGTRKQSVAPGGQPILAVAMARPKVGGWFVAGSKNSNAYVIDPDATKPRLTLAGHNGAIEGIAVSGDGKTIHTAGQDKTIRSWDSRTGKVTHVIDEHASHVQCLALSGNGRLLASGAQSGRIRLWDTVTGRLIRVLSGHTNTVYSLAFSPDAQRLVSGSFDRTVKVWQTSTGRRVTRKP